MADDVYLVDKKALNKAFRILTRFHEDLVEILNELPKGVSLPEEEEKEKKSDASKPARTKPKKS